VPIFICFSILMSLVIFAMSRCFFLFLIVSISRRQPCVISVLSVLRFYAR
jgi:hypothetical protein